MIALTVSVFGLVAVPLWSLIAVLLLMVAGGHLAFQAWLDRTHRRMAADYAERFPGKCFICSYHRFGLREGHTSEPRPPEHDCIEVFDSDPDSAA